MEPTLRTDEAKARRDARVAQNEREWLRVMKIAAWEVAKKEKTESVNPSSRQGSQSDHSPAQKPVPRIQGKLR